jgi:hypothetical protein
MSAPAFIRPTIDQMQSRISSKIRSKQQNWFIWNKAQQAMPEENTANFSAEIGSITTNQRPSTTSYRTIVKPLGLSKNVSNHMGSNIEINDSRDQSYG